MKLISCMITDDEPLARKGLQGYVEKAVFFDLKAQCEDAIELSEALRKQPVDLLFLDIQMPHLSGIAFLKALSHPPKVIFTTAFKEFAIDGFELDVLDYLLKPITFERFMKAAFKARDYFELKKDEEPLTYMFVKANGRLEKVIFDEILYIEGMENYMIIHTHDKKMIIHSTLRSLLDKLPTSSFVRTHKSFIVAVNKVTSIVGNTFYIGNAQIPVSRQLREQVFEKVIKNG